jgi:hypothetical protein
MNKITHQIYYIYITGGHCGRDRLVVGFIGSVNYRVVSQKFWIYKTAGIYSIVFGYITLCVFIFPICLC